MKKLVILKAGCKLGTLQGVKGDFEDWILHGLSSCTLPVSIVEPESQDVFPTPDNIAAIVITGSSAMVTEEKAWMLQSAKWLRESIGHGIPVLGICFGHQLLAYALGGKVDYNPKGVEVGTVDMGLLENASSDMLFTDIRTPVKVQVSHRQSVLELPRDAVRLAYTDLDENHAFRYGKSAWGVQFHPEFSREVVVAYIDYYAKNLDDANRDFNTLRDTVDETRVGQRIFNNFHNVISSG